MFFAHFSSRFLFFFSSTVNKYHNILKSWWQLDLELIIYALCDMRTTYAFDICTAYAARLKFKIYAPKCWVTRIVLRPQYWYASANKHFGNCFYAPKRDTILRAFTEFCNYFSDKVEITLNVNLCARVDCEIWMFENLFECVMWITSTQHKLILFIISFSDDRFFFIAHYVS